LYDPIFEDLFDFVKLFGFQDFDKEFLLTFFHPIKFYFENETEETKELSPSLFVSFDFRDFIV